MKENKSFSGVSASRVIFYVVASFLLSVFQSTLGKRIGLFGVTPQMTLALTVAAAFYQGPLLGALCGLLCGIFTEALGGVGIVLLPLFYTLAGWIIGAIAIEKKGPKGSSLTSFLINLAAATLAGGLITLTMFLINATKPNLPDALVYIILPEALNTYIFGLFVGIIYFAVEKLGAAKRESKKENLNKK